MSSSRWKILLGALSLPAIGFITLRVTFLALLLIAQLVLLPFDREIDEFPEVPFYLDLVAIAVALIVMVSCGRALWRFGDEAEADQPE